MSDILDDDTIKQMLVGGYTPNIGAILISHRSLQAKVKELEKALEGLVNFHDPDSLSDQANDPALRADAELAWEAAKHALQPVADPKVAR